MEDKTILHLQDLCVSYVQNGHEVSVLKNISFSLKEGEVLSLLGESGSGKSTIAKTITGLLPPSARIQSGTLTVAGHLCVNLTQRAILWNKIRGTVLGMVFQDAQLALNPLFTIKEHFREALITHKIGRASDVLPTAANLLKLLGFTEPGKVLSSYPFQLSGGMCQRVCIALTLCLRPSVLIADEPTSALDATSQKEVISLLKNVQRELGVAMLFITHDIAVANAVSNRVMVLNEGNIEEVGETQDVFSRPAAEYTQKLLAAHSIRTTVSAPQGLDAKPVIDVVDLNKAYSKNNSVIKDLCFSISEKEIIGVLGPSGCGKSTLAKCIAGIEPINSGEILYRGKNLVHLRGRMKRELCRHIQMIFQDARASLNPRYTAIQLVQEPLNYLNIGNKKSRKNKASTLLKQVGIDDAAKFRRPPQLSTGQCQRIAIARALTLDPKVLICDEAVSALDVCVQTQILELLVHLHMEYGFAILMISHDIRVLRYLCHRIAVMQCGAFCEIDSTDAVLSSGKSPHTKRLLECVYEM